MTRLFPSSPEDDHVVTLADVPHDPPPRVVQWCAAQRVQDGRVTICGAPAGHNGLHVPHDVTYPVSALEPGGWLHPDSAPF